MRPAIAGLERDIERNSCSVITITCDGEVVTTVALRTVLLTIPISPRKSPGPRIGHRLVGAILNHEELVGELALASQPVPSGTSSSSAC